MPLPYPSITYTPFDPLTAAELNQMVANIEALQDWSAFEDGSFDIDLLPDGGITLPKLEANIFGAGNVLWSGQSTVGDGVQLDFAENISDQPNGIVLHIRTNGGDWGHNYFTLHKDILAVTGSLDRTHVFVCDTQPSAIGRKYLSLYDNRILGHSSNTSGNSASYALMGVYGW